jgi:hypothetical protein
MPLWLGHAAKVGCHYTTTFRVFQPKQLMMATATVTTSATNSQPYRTTDCPLPLTFVRSDTKFNAGALECYNFGAICLVSVAFGGDG